MEEKSDEEVQEAALQVLRNIYGKAVQQPVACAVTRWAQDPYSKGEACIAQGYCTLQQTIQLQSAHSYSYSGVQYMLCDAPKLGCAVVEQDCHAHAQFCSSLMQ